jgi:hypothetical protein
MKTLGKLACAFALATCLFAVGCGDGAGDVNQKPPAEGGTEVGGAKDDGGAGAGAAEEGDGASLDAKSGAEFALVTLKLPSMT